MSPVWVWSVSTTIDLIVVGAGPAGLMSGVSASKHGNDVLIIDKKKEIGRPVQCAEGILNLVMHMFKLPILPEYNVTNRVEIYLPGGKLRTLNMNTIRFIVLDRELFEKQLASQVDGEIRLNEQVLDYKNGKVITDKGEYRAKYVVDASGYHSVIGNKVGLNYPLANNDYLICLQHTIEHPDVDNKVIKIYMNLGNAGYTWEFPTAYRTSNIGLGVVKSMIKGISLKRQLEDHLFMHYRGYTIISRTGGVCPCAKPLEKVTKGNVMVVGDAARMVLSQSGAGIPNSMKSGWLSGLCEPEIYEKYYQKYLYPELYNNWIKKGRGLRSKRFNLITPTQSFAYKVYSVMPQTIKNMVERKIAKSPKYSFLK